MPEAITCRRFHNNDQIDEELRRLDQEIRDLMRSCRMPSPYIELDYQAEPSFLRSLATYGDVHDLIQVRPPGFTALAGFGVLSRRRVWLRGRIREAAYLHHLRFAPQIRGGSWLLRSYRALRKFFHDHSLPLTLTSILADNRQARAALENKRAGGAMPAYEAVSRYLTALIPLRGPGGRWPLRRRFLHDTSVVVRQLHATDLQQLLDLFAEYGKHYTGAPAFAAEDFHAHASGTLACPAITSMLGAFVGPELCGAIGVWDQQSYKQTVLAHLCRPLALTRDFWQAGRNIWGSCPIPACGEQVNSVLLDPWAIRPGYEQQVAVRLLCSAVNEARQEGALFAAFGVAEKNPLIKAINAIFFLPYWSTIYQVYWPETAVYDFTGQRLHLSNLGAL